MTTRRPSGALEAQILRQLRRHREGLTPGQVRDAIEADGTNLAYTTVMTILSRLRDKGQATRERTGRAFRYTAVQTEAEAVATRMQAALRDTRQHKAALATFVSGLSAHDEQALRDLMRRMES